MQLAIEKRSLVFGGFTLSFRADLFMSGGKVDELPVVGGEANQDWNADVLRTCALQVPGLAKWVPSTASDPLWPTGNVEVQLFANMDFGSTTSGDLSLGVYLVKRPQAMMQQDGTVMIGVEGYDRALAVNRNAFNKTYPIAAGTNIFDVATDIISGSIPGNVTFNFPDDPQLLEVNLVWDRGDSKWGRLKELFRGHGYDLYFDQDGNPTAKPIVDPALGAISFEHAVVPGRCAILSGTKTLEDEETYNHVIAYSENTDNDAELWAEAFDDDPDSPTYIGSDDPTSDDFGRSPFGDKPKFVASNLGGSVAFLQRLAYSELVRSIGIQEDLEIETPWLPIDANDVNIFAIPNLKVENTYVIDAIRQTLEISSTMNLQTRQRRTTGVAG